MRIYGNLETQNWSHVKKILYLVQEVRQSWHKMLHYAEPTNELTCKINLTPCYGFADCKETGTQKH
jgi:hypothetical protein